MDNGSTNPLSATSNQLRASKLLNSMDEVIISMQGFRSNLVDFMELKEAIADVGNSVSISRQSGDDSKTAFRTELKIQLQKEESSTQKVQINKTIGPGRPKKDAKCTPVDVNVVVQERSKNVTATATSNRAKVKDVKILKTRKARLEAIKRMLRNKGIT